MKKQKSTGKFKQQQYVLTSTYRSPQGQFLGFGALQRKTRQEREKQLAKAPAISETCGLSPFGLTLIIKIKTDIGGVSVSVVFKLYVNLFHLLTRDA
jgi:hypothetical protein